MVITSGLNLGFKIIRNQVYITIHLNDMAIPSYYDPARDYYLLERFTLSKSDLADLYVSQKIELTQQVLYYMRDELFMTSHVYMGGFDARSNPKYIDISDKVIKGISNFIDTETNAIDNVYVYRIIWKNGSDMDEGGEQEYSTSYVIGIKGNILTNVPGPEANIKRVLGENIVEGRGSQFIMDNYGKIILKGIPMIHGTPRYEGPIDEFDFLAAAEDLERCLSFLENTNKTLFDGVGDIYDQLYKVGELETGGVMGLNIYGMNVTWFGKHMSRFIFMTDENYMS